MRIIRKTALKKRKHGSFFGLQRAKSAAQFVLGLGFQFRREIAVEIRIQHDRMNVAFSADGGCVSQPRRDPFDSGAKIAFGLCRTVEAL